jgi:hypothetical protein
MLQILTWLFLFQTPGKIPKQLVDSVAVKNPKWVEMWKQADGFQLDSFITRTHRLAIHDCDTAVGRYDSLETAIFNYFSHDSSFVIDAFSGTYQIKINNGRLIGKKTPATGIKIVNMGTGDSYRTMFSSSGACIDDVFWLDNRHAVLLGYTEAFKGSYRPFVMKIDCAGKTALICESGVLLRMTDKPEYYRTRFPDVYWSRSGQ